MTVRIAIYLRVSTSEQKTDSQRRALQEAISHRENWELVKIYEDAGVSGSRAPREREAMKQLLQDATRRRFDMVAAWSVDRLGRSLQDLVSLLGEWQALGIGLYLHQQALDTSTPTGMAMFQMVGVFAEFERQMIRARVQAGVDKAKENGQALGGARNVKISPDERVEICERRFDDGASVIELADDYGVSRQTIYRIIRAGLPENRDRNPFDWLS